MKVLGLDIGTNSIGWGIVDEAAKKIVKCGVYIFPEGVKKEKGNESSKAAERTAFRSARRLKFRRRLRKYETLKVLIKNGMCPLTMEELDLWKTSKIYPSSTAYLNWYRTDELKSWEPYFLRKKCVEQKADPYEQGRAFYHLAQRRGFLSNRKEAAKESEDKDVKGIKGQMNELSELKGDKTLGQYFYELKQSGERVRGKYTSRKDHYEQEFNKICEVQNISDELKESLYKAIFYQRKLKSQKFLVGKCTLEPDKPRCPVSHFEFEEFRMLQFINSIRVARDCNEDDKQPFEPLTEEEREIIKPLFFRISKRSFHFADISKKLAGKKEFWKFNYRDDTNVSGCPVSTGLKNIFGDDWKNIQIGRYDINDIWHVLFDFDDNEKLREFAIDKLLLDDDKAGKYCAVYLAQGYASLSLKAIRKIIPFLKKGYVYSTAVFLANIPSMIGKEVFEKNEADIEKAVQEILSTLKDKNNVRVLVNRCLEAVFKDAKHDFHTEEWNKSIIDIQACDLFGKKSWEERSVEKQNNVREEAIKLVEESLKLAVTKNADNYKYPMLRTDDLIEEYLTSKGFEIKKGAKLYHPSDQDFGLEKPVLGDDGKEYLSSPRTSSVKNPVAMRALYQLKKLVNYLIKTDEIDGSTRINVELANEVNDKNWRKAIGEFQRKNELRNIDYKKQISGLCKEAGFEINPTDSDIKKFRLWKEQKEKCPYTGKSISIVDLFGKVPKFDFEHTIPRSLSYDDSLENLTLCDSDFNRNVKKQHIPSELPNFEEICARFKGFYKDEIYRCESIISRNSNHVGYIDPAAKDSMIVRRHEAQLELRYYKEKLKRFTATEITSGFKNSQLNDTRIITKLALKYLRQVFDSVQPVKGTMTDIFKRQWGLLDRDEVKDRSNYIHHAVDALTVACVSRAKFNLLSHEMKNGEEKNHINFAKPWESFDKDVVLAVRYIIPKHFVDDNSLRQSKKILRRRGGLNSGKTVYIQCSTARGSLHKDTFYGCIMTVPEKGVASKKIFVERVPAFGLTEDIAEKIVDKKIKDVFINNIKTGIQTENNIREKGILLPFKKNGKDVYVRHIRIKAKPTDPVKLKEHHNAIKKNQKEYKQHYYVVNEENYLVALYRGISADGKRLSKYSVLNLLDAVKNKRSGKELYPNEMEEGQNRLPLYKVLKVGKIVLLQNDYDEDVFGLPKELIWNRLYRIAGLGKSGERIFIKLAHIICSKPWQYMKGEYDLNTGVEFRLCMDNNFIGLVEGTDFTVSPAGEIIKK
ncbi:type II CRISPR RNA-guided endonuclease Cas9 [Treponema parvum]|uniref:type II CRISPR RNA-guided endonuclease Cas9 n=1 Tax=Treponema parvum TaxID=138851 RepID=UPI001AEC6380|nr:type II CRISPR RNA-guided endonuclease Cas9 [Treponema parvum]QTQ16541.1 hypothetical protein HXT04_07485 [Treponema parvum]